MLDIETIRQRIADGVSSHEIAKEFNTSREKVQRFARENDLGPWVSRLKTLNHAPIPVPDDFVERAKVMTHYALEKHYNRSWSTILQWFETSGAERLTKVGLRVPDNLAELVQNHTIKEIAEQLNCGRDAIRRMIKAQGLYKKRVAAKTINRPAAPKLRNILPFKPLGAPLPAKETYNRDMTRLGLAVEFLKTLGPVYRRGDAWMRGNTLMSDAEIIQRADEIRERDVSRAQRANHGAMLQRYGS